VKKHGYELMTRIMKNNAQLTNVELCMWLTGDLLETIVKSCPRVTRLVGRYHRPFSKDMDDRMRHWQISETLARSGIRQVEVYDLVWSEQAAQALIQVAKAESSSQAQNAGQGQMHLLSPLANDKLKTPRKLVLDAQSLSAPTLSRMFQLPNLTALEVNSFPE
jgi:hypothetical protein